MSPPLLTVDDYITLPAVPADQRIQYGENASQFADLYLPEGDGPHPVLIVVHGGCWRARFGLEQLGRFCAAFKAKGVAVYSLEYRRLGDGGGWPTTFQDVAEGVDSLRTVAKQAKLDLGRVVATGHSAGGHLVCWLAGRHRLQETDTLYTADPLPLTAVVALAPLPDLAAAVDRGLCGAAPHELVGGMPHAMPQRYRQASPSALLPFGVPHTHILGNEDAVVPVDYMKNFAHAAEAAGDNVSLILLPNTGHFEIVTPGSAVWATVQNAILSYLRLA